MPAAATPTGAKSNVKALNPGTFWSRHSYGKVVRVEHDGVIVENEQGLGWKLDFDLFEKEFSTADQFSKTEKITRTEMVNKIVSSTRIVMTIFFRKKAEHKDLVDAVVDLLNTYDGSKPPTRRKLSATLKNATAGAERTMIGRHFGTTDEFGRIQFLDVEGSNTGMKTVDPRTVDWCIIDNVRYEVK